MAYTIVLTDGATLTTVAALSFDTSTTSITLIGQGAAEYGQQLNDNFVHTLENFADNTAPNGPLVGQPGGTPASTSFASGRAALGSPCALTRHRTTQDWRPPPSVPAHRLPRCSRMDRWWLRSAIARSAIARCRRRSPFAIRLTPSRPVSRWASAPASPSHPASGSHSAITPTLW